MTKSDYTLVIDPAPSDDQIGQLRQALRNYHASIAGPGGHMPLLIALNDPEGNFAGGLFAKSSYRWLFVDLLWVAEHARGNGHGARLLQAAEEEARARGCHNAWLDTFNLQARSFYEKNGYAVFGELPDHPPGFARYFLRKSLC